MQLVLLQGLVNTTEVRNPLLVLTEQERERLAGRICWQYAGVVGRANPSGMLRAMEEVAGRLELGVKVQVMRAEVRTVRESIWMLTMVMLTPSRAGVGLRLAFLPSMK